MFGDQPISLTWTFLGFTHDGSTFKTYQNGALLSSSNGSLTLNSSRPLRIGAGKTEAAPDYFFKGLIDEVRIYNRALSSSEMLDLYFQGQIFQIPASASMKILTRYYRGSIYPFPDLQVPSPYPVIHPMLNMQTLTVEQMYPFWLMALDHPESFFTNASQADIQ